MKGNTDPRRTHSAVCAAVQMTPAAQAPSAAEKALYAKALYAGDAWHQSSRATTLAHYWYGTTAVLSFQFLVSNLPPTQFNPALDKTTGGAFVYLVQLLL